MKKFILAIFASFAVFGLLFAPIESLAQEYVLDNLKLVAEERGAGYEEVQLDPRLIVSRIFGAVFGLVGGIFLVYFFFGASLIALSSGDEEKINKGKSTIRTSTIGIIIGLSGLALTSFITRSIMRAVSTPDPAGLDFNAYVEVAPGEIPRDPFNPTDNSGSNRRDYNWRY